MNNSGNQDSAPQSGGGTVTPASITLPLAPIPAALEPPADRQAPWPIKGGQSQVTSIDQARGLTQDLIAECKHRFNNGDPKEIFSLLSDHPELMAEPWVRETCYVLVRSGVWRKRQGRPWGTFEVHPLVVVGLVNEAIRRGEAKTPERALRQLDELGWGPYYSLKQRYYRALGQARFAAVFVEKTDQTRPATGEDMARLAQAERIQPGMVVKRRFEDPRLGSGEFVLAAQKADNT